MLTAILSKALDLKELEHLDIVKDDLFTVVRKHRRKLIRVKLYLNWERKYQDKTVTKWVLRTVTGRLWGARANAIELEITYNQLSYLISVLDNAAKNYLELVKKI